jgi:phospholipid-binding lipoprotein MlaA
MKVILLACFPLALYLVMAPTAFASTEASIPISTSNEANSITIAMRSPEPSSDAESPRSLVPLDLTASADREEESDDTFLTEVPSSQPEKPAGAIADPLEPVNRAFFTFNDKLYFWIFKPIATGYKAVIPEDGRIGIRNFFSNVKTPVRLVNCLFQAKFKGAGNEMVRFVLNTTIGIAGFFDPAKKTFKIEKNDVDFGQTLGVWGMGPVFYIDLPILGPSSLRDGLGYVGDLFFDPQTYLAYIYLVEEIVDYATWAWDKANETSLSLGEYENLKKAALDPYVALREAYAQYRQNLIKKQRKPSAE